MAVVVVVVYAIAYWLTDTQLTQHDFIVTILTDGAKGRGGMRTKVSNMNEGCGPYLAALDASKSTELDRVLLGVRYIVGFKPFYGTRPPSFTCRNADGTGVTANIGPVAIGVAGGETSQPEPRPVVPLTADSPAQR